MNPLKQPGWLRALEILTGLLAIVMGVLVLVYPDWAMSTLIALLSIGLFFVGIRSISLVGYGSLSRGLRALSVISGIIDLILAVVVLVVPGYGLLTLLILVSVGLLMYGFGRIFLASELKTPFGWQRGMMVAVGVLDIILSIVVLLLPGYALATLVVVLSVALLVSGVEMIISGATGRTWLGNVVKDVKDEMGGK
ncbi:MAG TPA: DUF308 domain-containing protein [candidate division Zixibacteria bacterium]|nr:DUF308 domain-containing protein [candidate division Zixibacteria bacterium]